METDSASLAPAPGALPSSETSPLEGAARAEAAPRQVLEEHGEWILRTAELVALAKGIRGEEAKDFAGWVITRLLDRDGALLAACRRPETIRAYLRSVIGNLLRDYRNHLWGKWRPSAAARRLGADAVELERLCHRDGWTLAEAIEILRARPEIEHPEQLEALAARLPHRPVRRVVDLDVDSLGIVTPVDEGLAERDHAPVRARVEATLRAALAALEDEDRSLLHEHFTEGRSLAAIARARRLAQRSLYTRKDRSLRMLRNRLQEAGLSWQEIEPAVCQSV